MQPRAGAGAPASLCEKTLEMGFLQKRKGDSLPISNYLTLR